MTSDLARCATQPPNLAPSVPLSGGGFTTAPSISAQSLAPWSLYRTRQRWTFLVILFLVTTSNYLDYYVLSIVLEPIKREFQVSDTMLGLLSGFCFAAIYAVAGIPIARWADRGNRRTVITLALTGWSVMTALCGVVHSFWQLAAARFGLGITEPGANPPAQSLIADYFPAERRATAFAILNSGSAAGWLVGVALGGYIAATLGWRAAFLVTGASGLLLAVVVRLVLPEPRSRLGFPASNLDAESITSAFLRLRRKKSFSWALVAISLYMVFALGINIFLPSFMIRALHATLSQVSLTWGVAISAATLLGAITGGWTADRLGQRDIRWYAWLPAIACATGALLYWLALSMNHLAAFIALDFLAEAALAVGISVSFAAVHAVCGNQRRAMAIAIMFFFMNLIGGGFGPLLVGVLSDAFTPVYGSESLRYSLMTMVGFLLPAAMAFHFTACAMPADRED